MISLRASWSARRSVSFCLTTFTSRGSASRPAFSTISNSIVAAVVSRTVTGGLLLWTDEKLERAWTGRTARRGASAVPSSVARSVHHLLREVEHDVALTSADGIEQGEGQPQRSVS